MKPMRDRVIVVRKESDEVTESGILIPNPKKENTGTVVAVGENVTELTCGDTVVFPVFAGQVLPGEENRGLMVFYQAEILAVIE